MTFECVGLRAECRDDPFGVEVQQPRLSWRLQSDRIGARQVAYRVRVATSPKALGDGGADIWDSGQVSSPSCFDVVYEGPVLQSQQRCWWSVRVWDEIGASADSAPAWWEMGLLQPGDWSAAWVAVETEEDRADRETGLAWIWGRHEPETEPRRFRLRFHLAEAVAEAGLFAVARGRLSSVWLDGAPIALPEANPHAFGREGMAALELGALAAGDHVLAAEVAKIPTPRDPRPWRGAFGAMLKFRAADGAIQRLAGDAAWKTSLAAPDGWTAPAFDDRGWEDAGAAEGRAPHAWPPTPAMLLRTAFDANQAPTQARLYVTALGAYEAFLNGARVSDALLAPESTDFRKRVLYQTYDVTDLVRSGQNVLGAHVGDGWYASVVAPGGRYAFGPAPRRFLAQLELTFADGSRQLITSGPGWRTRPSPVVESEIYNGETWDARRELPGWSQPGFDDNDWAPARTAEPSPGHLSAQPDPPIRVTQTLQPQSVSEPRPGVSVFDFGQNFAGVCRLRAQGRAGDRVTLRFAELLAPDGQIDQANLRAARATDVYILRGDPAGETFQPSFTYHGFRYVQIEGYPGRPALSDLDGLVVQTDLAHTGALRIDNPVIQQFWRNAVWSQRSNFTGIPTDCPQRDERLGWLGDANVFWDAAAYNMDVYAFTQRFSCDMRDAQAPGGGFSDYAPAARRFNDQPAPGWADAGVVLPWTAWRRYGCTSIIDANWAAIERYLGYIEDSNPDGLWRNNRGLDFGDWLALDARSPGDPTTPKDLIGTAWWAHTTSLAAQMAQATGRTEPAIRLGETHDRIATAFQRAFVGADGAIGNGSQTGYILALKFGLVPEALRGAAAERLTDDIEGRGGILSTGFLGTPFSLDVLADAGRADLVYDLLLRTEFPSWGYMIARGATTIWERWNGDVGDVAMNSFNHYALGAVAGFLFRRIAGIDAAAPGFTRIDIRPVLDPRLRRAGADYDSVLGRISTDWDWDLGSRFTLTATIPPNATARVRLPAQLGRRAELVSGAARSDSLIDAGDPEFSVDLSAGRHTVTLTL